MLFGRDAFVGDARAVDLGDFMSKTSFKGTDRWSSERLGRFSLPSVSHRKAGDS
jgi:hypothetical protein